ncbi:hypothetical protein M1N68_00835 [Peptococcaceae bacterium]|nr:hypothetical protein [Peptococcaceae bacterium]
MLVIREPANRGLLNEKIEDPDSSEVLFPAKFKSELDWDTINKLCMENRDFKEFIKRIKNDIFSKEVRKGKYDKLNDMDKLKKIIKEKFAQ